MTFLSSLWAAVFLVTGGLALLPHDLKPKAPIEQQGKFRVMPSPYITMGSGYKPTSAPSDSIWEAEADSLNAVADSAWTSTANDWNRAQAEWDSTQAVQSLADTLGTAARADSLQKGLINPRDWTWEEFKYQKAKAEYWAKHHNKKLRKKQHIKELNGKTDEPHNWAERNR